VEKFRQVAAVVGNFDLYLSGLCAVALVGLTTVGVIMRYLVGSPIIWMEEVQILLFVWVAFFGAAVAFRSNNHIVIEAMVELFPASWQRAIEVFDSFLVFGVLVLVAYWEYSRGTTLLRTGRSTSILNIPTALNYFGVAVACLFMLAHFVRQRLAAFNAWRAGRRAAGRDS
jgi:TRAP-type C4-dicarboxylate transport system permease small subunit